MGHHVYVPFPGMSGPWWESSFIVNVYFSHAAVWCPITFTFALIILWTSFLHEECKWAPTERSVSRICLVLTGRSWSRAAWAVLTCHQNTVLGFSTMGPGLGRVWLAPARAPGTAHWALRGHNRWITCQCLSFSVFNQRGYLRHAKWEIIFWLYIVHTKKQRKCDDLINMRFSFRFEVLKLQNNEVVNSK